MEDLGYSCLCLLKAIWSLQPDLGQAYNCFLKTHNSVWKPAWLPRWCSSLQHAETHAMFTEGNADLQNLDSWHIYFTEVKPWNTRLQVVHYRNWSSCSFKSSRSFASDSDLLHNAEFNMGPYRKQTSTKHLAHCANAHASKRPDWLSAPLRPAPWPELSSRIARQSQNAVNILHLSSVVENAEQQTTLKALPTLRK